MLKKILLVSAIALSMTACSLVPQDYSQPKHLLFQQKKSDTKTVYVERDDKLCAQDRVDQQDCPIDFYIDDFKSGEFFINNTAQYELKNNTYTLKVKNCTKECAVTETEYIVNDQLTNRKLTLSVDANGLPFIIQHGLNIDDKNNDKTDNIEKIEKINLNVDTLFKFDRFSLADLLQPGRDKLDDVADKIINGYVKVSHIGLTGHTDRLGTEEYNQQLAQNRANTVRDYLIAKGIDATVISTASAGESQPVTSGCQGVTPREALHACLQPDRRVEVEIKGIRK